MLRPQVLQPLLDLFEAPRYLEVGVNAGQTFHALRAGRRVAVDPGFLFDTEAAAAENPDAVYHAVPSDQYFTELHPQGERFDLVYLDGLHTFEQTLRDLLNTLSVVHERSVIVVDDVLPTSYDAALPDLGEVVRLRQATGEGDGSWMGDVYRLVYFVAGYMPMFRYATISDNHGQLVMWRGARPPVLSRTVEQVARATYLDSVLDRAPFNVRPYAEVLADIRAAHAA